MNILIINGSARNNGVSSFIAKKLADKIKENSSNTQVNILTLADKNIMPCKGCVACCSQKNKYCFLKDDINQEVYNLMETADSLVIISPIYEAFISGMLKTFFDRTNHYTSFFKLAGKPLNLILSGVQPLVGETKEFSNKHVVANIKQYFKNYSYITHTYFKFLKFFQVENHHDRKIAMSQSELTKCFDKMAKKLLIQKIKTELIDEIEKDYSV